MAKGRSFADKMNKQKASVDCPVCKSPIQSVLVVEPSNAGAKGSWKFRERFVGLCKCNHKEIYG